MFSLKHTLKRIRRDGFKAASQKPIPECPWTSETFRIHWFEGFYGGIIARHLSK